MCEVLYFAVATQACHPNAYSSYPRASHQDETMKREKAAPALPFLFVNHFFSDQYKKLNPIMNTYNHTNTKYD